jgi:hypothetical protein
MGFVKGKATWTERWKHLSDVGQPTHPSLPVFNIPVSANKVIQFIQDLIKS